MLSLQIIPFCFGSKSEADPWKMIRDFVDDFNSNRRNNLTPGGQFCYDESMSQWKPRTSKTGGLPHLSFVQRRPMPLRTEFKNVVDCDTGLMYHLEIQEGKVGMADKKHVVELGGQAAHTLVSYNRQREPETDQTGEVAAVDSHGSTDDESDADGDSKVPGKPSRIQRNCTWCHRVHHVNTKTSYKCAQCDLPFCGGYAENNCFAKHQAAVGLPAKDSWKSSPTHVAEECACCIRNAMKKLKRAAKKTKRKQPSKSKKRKLAKGRASLPPC